MPNYRRAFVPGGTYFFTLVTERRAPFLCTPRARTLLRSALRDTLARWPFDLDAIVLLPDHLHTLWTLPPGDAAYPRRWAFLKKEFTKHWLAAGGWEQPRSASRVRHRRRGVLQRHYWEHTIRDEADFGRHCDYIHYNPVKHGLVACPHAWPFSSFHRLVRLGWYEADWGCCCDNRRPNRPDFGDIEDTVGE